MLDVRRLPEAANGERPVVHRLPFEGPLESIAKRVLADDPDHQGCVSLPEGVRGPLHVLREVVEKAELEHVLGKSLGPNPRSLGLGTGAGERNSHEDREDGGAGRDGHGSRQLRDT